MLYNALTNKESTQGMENFKMSFVMFSVPKNLEDLLCSISHLKELFGDFIREKLPETCKEHKNCVEPVVILRTFGCSTVIV